MSGALKVKCFTAVIVKTKHVRSKTGYTATPVMCGWACAVLEKVTWASGQEQ